MVPRALSYSSSSDRVFKTVPRAFSYSSDSDRVFKDKEKQMTYLEQYTPGPATGAHIQKVGEKWRLVLVRELRHGPEKVWQALTDPAHLREWAPFDADGNLGAVGTVNLTTVGAPAPRVTETKVTKADAPKLLEYNWGDFDMRWELEALGV